MKTKPPKIGQYWDMLVPFVGRDFRKKSAPRQAQNGARPGLILPIG